MRYLNPFADYKYDTINGKEIWLNIDKPEKRVKKKGAM